MPFPSTTGETNSQSTLLAPTMITMEPGGIKLKVLGQSCLQNMTPQYFSLLHGVLQMQYYPQYMEEDIQSQSKCLIHQHHQLWHWHHQWLPTCLSQSMCSSRLVSASILCVWQGERVALHQRQCHEQSRRWPRC